MRTPANIAHHPIHPMLVPLPIGLWIFSFACDIVALFVADPATWKTVALYAMVGGIVGALLAAVFGLIDLLSLPRDIRPTGIVHMSINLGIVVLYVINAWVRIASGDAGAASPGLVWLSLVAIALLVVSGWLGGKMVYRSGVGVDTETICGVGQRACEAPLPWHVSETIRHVSEFAQAIRFQAVAPARALSDSLTRDQELLTLPTHPRGVEIVAIALAKGSAMASTLDILVFGASYGSLLAVKLLGAGHAVTLVCRSDTARLIEADGIRVRMPAGAHAESVEVDSRRLPGRLSACSPAHVDPAQHDLVVLAMQEPQYRAPELRDALRKVARAKVPCMSIMNMPPLPYLARIPGLALEPLRIAYSDASVWDDFDPALVTLCSPDPQAFRPQGAKRNVLQVGLPTNFKTAKFASPGHDALLDVLQRDIEAARFPVDDESIALPVKLKVHDSPFVPFAKWSMLLAGNYRCVQRHGMRSIAAAVHEDRVTAHRVYEWVATVCRKLGASDDDLVPFDKYAAAAASLGAPSSAARALANDATHIERVDRLVQAIAAGLGMRLREVDHVVEVVDGWVATNRRRERELRLAERAAA
jgi:uncharacterized membrane protein